eukprot:2877264-Prymnesium_polylepis.2
MPVAMWSSAACSTSGDAVIIFLVLMQWRLAEPSMAYATRVKGEPTKPTSVVCPAISAFRSPRIVLMNGSFESGSLSGVSAATSAIVRSGEEMTGPLPRTTSNSMPIAGSGVRMSENMMTPSTPNARHGCSESSIAMSG